MVPAPTEPDAPGGDAQSPAAAGGVALKPMRWSSALERPGAAICPPG